MALSTVLPDMQGNVQLVKKLLKGKQNMPHLVHVQAEGGHLQPSAISSLSYASQHSAETKYKRTRDTKKV